MAEWLYEAGIGEARAALVDADGHILIAAIEPDDAGPLVGAVHAARLVEILPGRTARAALATGEEVLVAKLPHGLAQGRSVTVEIVREAIPEPGRRKPPRAVVTDAAPAPGPDLAARIAATGHPVRTLRAHEADRLEQAGWSEVLEEAMTGDIAFPGGALILSPTPAMTLFDIDGAPPLEALALAGASAVAAAIVRHGIGGSIGIDFPTIEAKAPRHAVAAAIDAGLPQPFERTAVNGFGFLQIVRPRPRASLPERLRGDPGAAAARALLRRIEREPPGGPRHHRVPAPVARALAARPDWLAELARRTGVDHRMESA
ncbi:hypothetical protein GCM10011380_31290 [Sphingomonas metalli]|uniref:Uncharacterized protein n=1 Tax=Sphingomonas metalli TaxID=1779358 RepID=A0A916TEG8_9SPHN|nr:ribonuclease [Sphingomonas metalli]GGB39516.1 hypothetical protein GCM10011380_31290 [Sphingomonas metalli]